MYFTHLNIETRKKKKTCDAHEIHLTTPTLKTIFFIALLRQIDRFFSFSGQLCLLRENALNSKGQCRAKSMSRMSHAKMITSINLPDFCQARATFGFCRSTAFSSRIIARVSSECGSLSRTTWSFKSGLCAPQASRATPH